MQKFLIEFTSKEAWSAAFRALQLVNEKAGWSLPELVALELAMEKAIAEIPKAEPNQTEGDQHNA